MEWVCLYHGIAHLEIVDESDWRDGDELCLGIERYLASSNWHIHVERSVSARGDSPV